MTIHHLIHFVWPIFQSFRCKQLCLIYFLLHSKLRKLNVAHSEVFILEIKVTNFHYALRFAISPLYVCKHHNIVEGQRGHLVNFECPTKVNNCWQKTRNNYISQLSIWSMSELVKTSPYSLLFDLCCPFIGCYDWEKKVDKH